MTSPPEDQNRAQKLRQEAEEALRGQLVDLDNLPVEDIHQVIHELQVHQAELTLQNQQLRQIQADLEMERKRYADLYHAAPVGYCTLDRRGRILEANETLARILGVERGKLLQSALDEYVERDNQDAYYLHRQRAMEGLGRQVDVIRMVPSAGEHLFMRLESVPAPGDETRLAVILSNISDHMRAEAEIEKLNHEFQAFAFMASHDMQEPLRKIRTFSKLLLERSSTSLSTEKNQDSLMRMENAADRLQMMLDGLLAYSRITSRAQPYAKVSLSQIVDEVLSGLELRLHQTGGNVEVGELPEIEAEPHQMRLLFHSLIENALKFTHPGVPPRVKIAAAHNSSDGGPAVVQVTVEDNGIGFDMSHADNLFHPFVRLVGRSAYEGSGIGLAIARKIVERHGGQISVQSIPGQGSTFTVALPLQQ